MYKEEPQRLQVLINVTRFPGKTFDVEIAYRTAHGPFQGPQKASMSPTRFAYWANEVMAAQVRAMLLDAVLEQWGDELSQQQLDVDELSRWIPQERPMGM